MIAGQVTATYKQGSTIRIKYNVWANHHAYFELRLCPFSDPSIAVKKQELTQNASTRYAAMPTCTSVRICCDQLTWRPDASHMTSRELLSVCQSVCLCSYAMFCRFFNKSQHCPDRKGGSTIIHGPPACSKTDERSCDKDMAAATGMGV
jgi:hypothetical protein